MRGHSRAGSSPQWGCTPLAARRGGATSPSERENLSAECLEVAWMVRRIVIRFPSDLGGDDVGRRSVRGTPGSSHAGDWGGGWPAAASGAAARSDQAEKIGSAHV